MSVREINMNGRGLPIREFKLKWMVPNPSICMIAKRGSGKSWVVRSILRHFKSIPGGVIIAPTDKMNTFYGEFFPDVYIHYEYKSEIIEDIFYRQENMIKKCKEKMKQNRKVDPRAFLVMDDCLSSKGTWMKDQPISKLFYDGRHYKLMYILTMQFPLGITPELRANFDYIFLLGEDFLTNQKRLYDHYAGMFPDFNSFRQVFMDLTSDYGSMVIVNRGCRANFLDKIFWYKAENKEVDRIGCRQFNDFHKNNYDSSWRTRDRPYDIGKLATNAKAKARILVNKVGSGKIDLDNIQN